MPLSRVQSTTHLKRDYQPPGGTAQVRVLAAKAGLEVYDSVADGAHRGVSATSVPYVDPAESYRLLTLRSGFVRPLFNGRL